MTGAPASPRISRSPTGALTRSTAGPWTYDYTGNQTLTSGWNGTWSQSGRTVTAKNASWNGTIAAGAAVSTGAQFTYSGTNTAPASFAINGTTCTGAHQPPVTVLTSPAAGAVYTQGDAIPLAATAAAADNATIAKVEFYDDTTLLGTDTSSPYTLSTSSLAVGSHSLVAKAYDSLGASAASTPVGITVASVPPWWLRRPNSASSRASRAPLPCNFRNSRPRT